MPKPSQLACLAFAALITAVNPVQAGDWPGFRGPNANGIAPDQKIATTFDDSKNLKWKIKLPGPGSSSPIVIGDKIFVTCYTGYGTTRFDVEDISKLSRILLCVNRSNGKILWQTATIATLPEDTFRGYLTEHGYATSTPASDGQSVFVFYGKSGALAFDMDGKKLWQVNLGKRSNGRKWGSASSPILYKDTVIINASDESETLYALDKKTGKIKWKTNTDMLALTFGTPSLIQSGDRTDLVVAVPYELWGLNPDNGKLRWYAEMKMDGNISPSIVESGGVIYSYGGYRTKGSIAVKAGGKGNVTKTNVKWTSPLSSYVPSPVVHESHLYWVNEQGNAYCVNAKTGKTVYEKPLIGRGRGKPVYASPVLVGDKLICVTRKNGIYVLKASPTFTQIALNKFENDDSDFNASPALSNGQMFLRSNKFLYCVQSGE